VEAVYLIAPPSEDEEVSVMLQLSIFRGKEEMEKRPVEVEVQEMDFKLDPVI
jgi:hypothetical protein